MRRTLLCLACAALLLSTVRAEDPATETLPAGFKALFNGKDLTGWKSHGGKIDAWKVEKGVLYVQGRGGWLMTEKEYGDFELRMQYKLPKAGNSGVALRAPLKGDPAYQGMEIQIIDDIGYPGKLQKWQNTGSIYGVVAASKLASKPVGQWNDYRITCKGRQVTVELNGEKIVDANLDDHKEKHAKAHPGILRDKGHIGLQEHGGKVEFRNIHVKEL